MLVHTSTPRQFAQDKTTTGKELEPVKTYQMADTKLLLDLWCLCSLSCKATGLAARFSPTKMYKQRHLARPATRGNMDNCRMRRGARWGEVRVERRRGGVDEDEKGYGEFKQLTSTRWPHENQPQLLQWCWSRTAGLDVSLHLLYPDLELVNQVLDACDVV